MSLPVLDESVRYSCGSCALCCDQPWHVLIEKDKAEALDRCDFSAYPQLLGRTFYDKAGRKHKGFYRLAKGVGTRCLFRDTDGLCIIHKELGADAKPFMCRQFPYVFSHTRSDDRVSVNFGCPAVQDRHGAPLDEQAPEVKPLMPQRPGPLDPNRATQLDARCALSPSEDDALLDRMLALFDERTGDDVWSRFARLLALLATVREHKLTSGKAGCDDELVDRLRSKDPLPGSPEPPEIFGYVNPARAPMPARFLFAATLCPDTVASDAVNSLGLRKWLKLIPKMLSLATFNGVYASSLLGRNVAIHQVIEHPVDETLDPDATRLLVRYFRSRLWQRYLAGTRLSIIAGVHQHIQDLNAIVFFARAEALDQGESHLSHELIRVALTGVEFHFANQARLFDHSLKRWLRTQLQSLALGVASLRLMALKRPPEPAGASAAEQPATQQPDR